MHRCRVRRLAKYRRQPHINSGHDSDQRQLLTSVLRTMEADLNVSRRCFFEKIPKGRGYLYACENNLYKQVQKIGAILYLKRVVNHCDGSAKLNEDVFTLGVSDALFMLQRALAVLLKPYYSSLHGHSATRACH